MSCFFKSIITVVLLVVFSVSSLYSSGDCLSKYNCKLDINGTKIKGIKDCTLPNMRNMPITAVDVFETDGSLKTYFGWDQTVCHVLGWMNEGAAKFSKVTGMESGITRAITLKMDPMSKRPYNWQVLTGSGLYYLLLSAIIKYGKKKTNGKYRVLSCSQSWS